MTASTTSQRMARRQIRVHVMIDQLVSGGAQFLLAEFAEVAPEAGIELSVVTLRPPEPPSPAADRLRERGIEPEVVPVSSLLSVRDLRRVRRHLAWVRPDVVHTHLGTSDMLGNVAARSLGIPSVATIHADRWPDGARARARTALMSRARRHCAGRVIAVSESAKRAYIAARRDTSGHLVVVHNGLSARARPGSGAEIRRELGLDANDLVVAMTSNLLPEKNFETAIDAVAVLRSSFPSVRLVIVGDGDHEKAVRQRAAVLGDAAVLPGHREDIMAVLDASDVLVHPSHFDAFPTSLLEAMAASVPVVATATGGMLEMVEHGHTGLLVGPPPTAERFVKALCPVLAREEFRVQLGAAGRRHFEENFTAGRWAERLRAVYEDVGAAATPTLEDRDVRSRAPTRTAR